MNIKVNIVVCGSTIIDLKTFAEVQHLLKCFLFNCIIARIQKKGLESILLKVLILIWTSVKPNLVTMLSTADNALVFSKFWGA